MVVVLRDPIHKGFVSRLKKQSSVTFYSRGFTIRCLVGLARLLTIQVEPIFQNFLFIFFPSASRHTSSVLRVSVTLSWQYTSFYWYETAGVASVFYFTPVFVPPIPDNRSLPTAVASVLTVIAKPLRVLYLNFTR